MVGPYESDIKKGTISITSPLGQALMGKSVGEEVTFKAPGGERTYEVVKISIIQSRLHLHAIINWDDAG